MPDPKSWISQRLMHVKYEGAHLTPPRTGCAAYAYVRAEGYAVSKSPVSCTLLLMPYGDTNISGTKHEQRGMLSLRSLPGGDKGSQV